MEANFESCVQRLVRETRAPERDIREILAEWWPVEKSMGTKSAILFLVGYLKGYCFSFSSEATNRTWIISKRQGDDIMKALRNLEDLAL